MNKPSTKAVPRTKIKLSRRTKAFADKLLESPEISQTKAWLATHETTNVKTASVEAARTLAKPSVQIYMDEHVAMAKRVMVELAGDTAVKPADRIKAATDILDRVEGKAVQKIQTQNTNINLNVDASSELNSSFADFLKQQTQQG